MKVQTARKIGFWTALAMLFGTIVGIGIFFKNGSVDRATGGNGAATLVAWVIGGLISLFAAISFGEISGQKLKNVFGLAAWSEKALGKRFGYFTRFNLSVFYYGIITVIFGVFISEAFFMFIASTKALDFGKIPVYAHVIVGIIFDAFFFTINFYSVHKASWISRFSTVLKLVPLLLAALVGIILANTNHDVKIDDGIGVNHFTHPKSSFSFTGLLAAIPAVLFAYDAFLDAGTLANKVEGGSKTVSKVIVVTLLSVLTLYSLISISHILHGVGNVGNLFNQIFPGSAQKGLSIFIWFFLFVSATGVANGVTAAATSAAEQLTASETIYGAKTLNKKWGKRATGHFFAAIIFLFWSIIIFIPAVILKSDAIVDSISNFPTLFFFAIYGLTIFGYWRKRAHTDNAKINNKLFVVSSTLAIIGITFVVIYQLVYGFTIKAFIHPHDLSTAGFLTSGGQKWTFIEEFGLFVGALVAFFALPFINWFLASRLESHKVVVDTQAIEGSEQVEAV